MPAVGSLFLWLTLHSPCTTDEPVLVYEWSPARASSTGTAYHSYRITVSSACKDERNWTRSSVVEVGNLGGQGPAEWMGQSRTCD